MTESKIRRTLSWQLGWVATSQVVFGISCELKFVTIGVQTYPAEVLLVLRVDGFVSHLAGPYK